MAVDSVPDPETPYGRSKLLAERLVAEALAGSETEFCILSFPAIHGRGAPGAVGHLASWIKAGRPLPFCCGSVHRSVIGIDNAVDAILLACFHPRLAHRTAMPTDGDAPSVLELADRIARILGVRLRTVPLPRLALRIASGVGGFLGVGGRLTTAAARMLENSVVDDHTLRDCTGWAPPTSLDHGLALALREER
jgi:nucleoside-diphosphate-sugar epimerase